MTVTIVRNVPRKRLNYELFVRTRASDSAESDTQRGRAKRGGGDGKGSPQAEGSLFPSSQPSGRPRVDRSAGLLRSAAGESSRALAACSGTFRPASKRTRKAAGSHFSTSCPSMFSWPVTSLPVKGYRKKRRDDERRADSAAMCL